MKDIYSPLDIDEEWDNMEPMVDAPAMSSSSATSVAIKDDTFNDNTAGSSILSSDSSTMSTLPPAKTSTAVAASSNTGTEDAAYEVANADMGASMNNDDKLNIGEINPTVNAETPQAGLDMQVNENTDQDMKMAMSVKENTSDSMNDDVAQEKATKPIPVIDMNEATTEMTNTSDSAVRVGESFAPEEKPAKDRFEGMSIKEEKPANKVSDETLKVNEKAESQEPASAELPVTPSDKKNVSKLNESKAKMKFVAGEKVDSSSPTDSQKHLEKVKATAAAQSEDLAKVISGLETKREDIEQVINDKTAEMQDVESQIEEAKAQKDKIDQIIGM